MKHLIRMCWVLASVLLLGLTSCLRESSEQGGAEGDMQIASLQQQAFSVKSSMDKLAGIQTVVEQDVKNGDATLAELNQSLISLYDALSQHADYLKSGATSAEATMATLALQKKAAEIVAALEFSGSYITATKAFSESVKTWVGTSFEVYYDAALLRGQTVVGVNEMREAVSGQKLSLDAMLSDVEAGLREGVEPKEIETVTESVMKNDSAAESLVSQVEQTMEVLENECNVAVSALCEGTEDYNMATLTKAGAQAVSQMKSSAVTLQDLVSRVEACEDQVNAIRTRLGELEADVEQLLDMIQSVSFLSDYSSDYAVAYYEMKSSKVSAPGKAYDGKNQRDASGTFDLNFMIRPASAAAAVTAQTASVLGYYANQIQTRAVDPSNFVDLQIQSVSVTNAERGIVTVKVSHDLKDDFYYKAVGAKCALSVATGKTDITSKFIELVPKDNSSTVYVEGIKINTDDFEIDEGQTKNLTATVNPSSATNKTVKWTSSDPTIVSIDQASGAMRAEKQGNVTITATTNGIDEWGDNLTASVNVKVNPSVRIGGPLWVEVGKTAELSLDKPATMNIESQEWYTSDPDMMTVERVNGIVTVSGLASTYNEYTYQYNTVTVYCTINGTTTVSYEMKVVVPQPNLIRFNNFADDVNQIRIKQDQSLDLGGVILPAAASNLFRLYYESTSATGVGWVNKDNGKINEYNNTLPAETVTVYARAFEIDKHNRYATDYVYSRTITVYVDPYYVSTISFADVELEPGAKVTLVPTFTSDVSGKQPTNTNLTWESSNNQIATVDKNGLVTALGEGDVTITATATDGSGVKGTCKVTITAPWKEFEVGQYVVRRSNGEIDFFTSSTDAKNNGTVVGVVIYKGNPRVSDTKLPAECTHGIAIGLGEGIGKWWSKSQGVEPYHLTGYVNSSYNTAGYVLPGGVQGSFTTPTISALGEKPYGYNNTMLFKEFLALKTDTSSDIMTKLNDYNADNSKRTPTGASSWYLPSVYEMYAVYTANNLLNGNLNSILQGVGGTTLSNNSSYPYWTVSEHADSPSSYAAAINPITGVVYGKFKTTTSTYVRYFFAF